MPSEDSEELAEFEAALKEDSGVATEADSMAPVVPAKAKKKA